MTFKLLLMRAPAKDRLSVKTCVKNKYSKGIKRFQLRVNYLAKLDKLPCKR